MKKKSTGHRPVRELPDQAGLLQDTLEQLKETQQKLVHSEKLASLGQLAAGIAHDIKNPLNFVVNFADLSLERVKDLYSEIQTEKDVLTREKIKSLETLLGQLEENLQKIKKHGNRIDSLVKGMLLHSRGKAGELQAVNLNRLLEENLSLVYHSLRALDQAFDIKMEIEPDPTIGDVNLVPQDFSRAIFNIVNNACWAVQEKRKKAAPGFSPLVSVTTRNLGQTMEIRIRDNGNGIPGKYRDKLFTPFFTTKPAGSGTGLGLSSAHEIITQEHNGRIEFESREGEFTEFIITIPVH
jgi:signal transduction histidine kinase